MPRYDFLGTASRALSQGFAFHAGADASQRRSLAPAPPYGEGRRSTGPGQELQRRSGTDISRLQEISHFRENRRRQRNQGSGKREIVPPPLSPLRSGRLSSPYLTRTPTCDRNIRLQQSHAVDQEVVHESLDSAFAVVLSHHGAALFGAESQESDPRSGRAWTGDYRPAVPSRDAPVPTSRDSRNNRRQRRPVARRGSRTHSAHA